MKKLQKFLALAALAPMLAACAPSNEDVCQHVMDIMKKDMPEGAEAPSEEDTKEFMKKCAEDFEKEKKEMGAAEAKKQTKCIMAATDLEGIMKCEPEKKADEKAE